MTRARIELLLCTVFWTACQRSLPTPPPTAAKWPALNETFLASSAATMGFRLGKPQVLAIAPDGSVLFRRTGARDRRADLFVLDPGGRNETKISVESLLGGGDEQLSDAERARRERTRTSTAGVVDIDLSAAGDRILIPLGERVFVYDREQRQAHPAAVGGGYPYDPRIAPDGKSFAFVRDGDLFISPLDMQHTNDATTPRRLTKHEPGIEYGVAEFIAQEELDRARGYWWSPDSQTLAFQRTDARQVTTLYVSDPRNPERAPVEFKYPRPGANNAEIGIGLISARGGAPRWVMWDHERWPYVAHVQWSANAPLCLIVLNRAQTELALLTVDDKIGATRMLLQAHDDAWLNVPRGAIAWLHDGSGFLWLSEAASGWTLERYDASGKHLRTLTQESFGVRSIVGLDPDDHAVVVLASTDPRQQHVFRVPLDGSTPLALTSGGGVNSAIAQHGVVVISSALREGGSNTTVVYPDDRHETLVSMAERPELAATTRLESVEVDGKTFYTSITRPHAFHASQHYPVLLKVYGGPGVINVPDALDSYLLDQWYADAGFIVVRADGRGTPYRGRAWERAIYKDLITVPLADQVATLQAMEARHPEMDRSRVGLFGWSFGGYLSAMAVLMRPDVFKAAVAGAPVTDWSLYDSTYTERYMQTPETNPEGYKNASALTHASELRRPLLIMHGVTDDNVHFANTLALIEALFAAGKRAEVITLPGTHMLTDPKLTFEREKVQVDFFREHLAP